MNAPKVFISYSWDNEAHKEWVRQLATQLRADGVDARLDHWHAVPGDRLTGPHMQIALNTHNWTLRQCRRAPA
jgi:hypothetical protein